MTFYTGAVAAVPKANRAAYLAHGKGAWPLFRKYGALRMVDCWGVDIPHGKVNDFFGAVKAGTDETVAISWIEWANQASSDAAWARMEADPDMAQMAEMPYDGRRMIFGGFAPIFAAGTLEGAGYVQGFVLAVPEANKPRYIEMAEAAWKDIFLPHGATGISENWGVSVPHGRETDFYRATLAKDGEVPMFSWVSWPDRATCDKASAAMQAQEMPENFVLPFDGKRMIWGGFELIFDSARG